MKPNISKKTIQLFSGSMAVSMALAVFTATAANESKTDMISNATKGAGAADLTENSGTSTANESSEQMESSHSKSPMTAKSFLEEAIEGNSAEIALAEVAERKAQNPSVKQLAQMLREDHRQANQQLQPIAQAHGVTMNQSLDKKHEKKLDRFQKLSGAEFDQAYTKDMLKDHQKDISKYEKAAQQIQETDVKQYAQNTIPTLRKHLQHAEQAAQAAGVDQTTISAIMNNSSESMGGSQGRSDESSGSGTQSH